MKVEEGMRVYISDKTADYQLSSTGARFFEDDMQRGWVTVDDICYDGDFFIKGEGEYLVYSSEWIDWSRTLGCGSKRPERDAIINKDDQLNLVIAMETSQSLEQFLELV